MYVKPTINKISRDHTLFCDIFFMVGGSSPPPHHMKTTMIYGNLTCLKQDDIYRDSQLMHHSQVRGIIIHVKQV
jgi:hypothetical protein